MTNSAVLNGSYLENCLYTGVVSLQLVFVESRSAFSYMILCIIWKANSRIIIQIGYQTELNEKSRSVAGRPRGLHV